MATSNDLNNSTTVSTADQDRVAPAAASGESTHRASSHLRRAVAVVALAVLAIGSLIGVDAFSAKKASAATAVTFCFKYARSGLPATNLPVQLWQVNAAGQRIGSQLRGGKTNNAGCATYVNTPANARLRVFAYSVYGDSLTGMVAYSGATPYVTPAGQGTVFIGTGLVYKTCLASGAFYPDLCSTMLG